ncbi:MAG: hypothetical protein LBU60_04740 [Clostridiales bacterium]|jgi:hypothetical protein|nr:hypothetical protein [Clostridiales bacterium]
MTSWYKLDNVGHLYACVANSKWSGIFRLSAVLQQKVNQNILQQALDCTMSKFDFHNVRLRSGIFWHYFEPNKKKIVVQNECNYPCSLMDVNRQRHLLRVLYHNCRISVEFFHAICDGGGGWLFFNCLLHKYLVLCGHCDGLDDCIKFIDYDKENFDAFKSTADLHFGKLCRKTPKAYLIDYKTCQSDGYWLTHGEMNTNLLKALAKKYSVKVGQLLTAVLAFGIYLYKQDRSKKLFAKKNEPVVVNVSYDLRKKFGVSALRNFFSYALFELSDKKHTLDSVIAEVADFYKKIDSDYLLKAINTNVRDQQKLFNRLVPLCIKKPLINYAYNAWGEKLASISFSNYGNADVPACFANHIVRLESANGVAKVGRVLECSSVSFNDKTVLTFCSKSKDTLVERIVFGQLVELGLQVGVVRN